MGHSFRYDPRPLADLRTSLAGIELGEYAMMRKAGAKAVSTGRGWVADSGVMHKVLTYAASLGLTVISHAEDAGLAAGAVATASETSTRLGLSSAPAEAEAIAIARDLMLAELTGARLHFRTVTTAKGLDLIRDADGDVVWSADSKAFFYVKMDDNHRPCRVFLHRLGEPQAKASVRVSGVVEAEGAATQPRKFDAPQAAEACVGRDRINAV